MSSSVKVAVRVRPFNEREKGSKACIVMNGPTTVLVDPNTGDERPFTFDYSFWSHDGFRVDDNGIFVPTSPKYADQNVVYEALGKQVLDNAWEGYNCCLFAYGQTGSGKSYSMIGYGANVGIVPISCAQIFERIRAGTTAERQYQVQFSMIEIYNEKVQDLLVDPSSRPKGGLKVREHKTLGVYVQDLGKHPVDSYEAIEEKMDEGQCNRSIGSTQMNATSSRAHTVITIEFKQVIQEGGRTMEKVSTINLVDLAGSEKAGQTGATGDRLKEGCAINQSLTTLGQCISVLADKACGKAQGQVVPYRNSALTRILQTALGGNSKTIMVCALSPSFMNYEETLSTLRYADRAKKIKNKAAINESPQDKMIRELKAENQQLKQMLKKLAAAGGDTINLAELGITNMQEMLEDMEENEKIMEDLETPWEQKLAAAKAGSSAPNEQDSTANEDTRDDSQAASISGIETTQDDSGQELFNQSAAQVNSSAAHQESDSQDATPEQAEEDKEADNAIQAFNPAAALGLRKARRDTIKKERGREKNVPHITNLSEDPQMSGIVYNSLINLKNEILIGRKTGQPQPDIILGAIGIQKNHAKIKLQSNGLFKMTVVAEAAINTLVNGEPFSVQKRSRILNHCDRLSFASNIYVFKYPKLKRAMNELIDGNEEIKGQEQLTRREQEELAWQLIQQNGLPDFDPTNQESLAVADYSGEEKLADEQAVDWDMAFSEVEFGEEAKLQKIAQDREEAQRAELERQKKLHDEQMQSANSQYEEQKRQDALRQQQERERIAREKSEMESQLAILQEQENDDKKRLQDRQAMLILKEQELELARNAMEEKESEHQRQIEEQKVAFYQKERELETKKVNKQRIDALTRDIKPKIDEANQVALTFNQQVSFSFTLVGKSSNTKILSINPSAAMDMSEKKFDIEVKVNNLDKQEVYTWTRDKFEERFQSMKDLFSNYEESGQLDPDMENPFVDQHEPTVIGEGYYVMEPLAYLIDNPTTLNLIGTNYESRGSLFVNVIPLDADGSTQIQEDDLPDVPEDLLNRQIDYIVSIERATDLPTNFCKDVFVEYSIYLDETKFKTNAVEGKNRNPEFGYEKRHTQPVVTEGFLKYIKDEVIAFKVYGFPDVKDQSQAVARNAQKKKAAAQAQAATFMSQ